MAKTFVSASEAARLLGVSEGSVRAYSRRGVRLSGLSEPFRLTRYGTLIRRVYDLDEINMIKASFEEDE